MTLTERQRNILRIVVHEYVDTTIPVGSEVVTRKYRLGVSPATVRNEMAELEDSGYITHPHTSAGRIPSDHGYRYFVESLMEETALPISEQTQLRHQFHQVELRNDEWLRLAAAAIARFANNVAVVTPAIPTNAHFRHVQLLRLQDRLVLLALVLQQGIIKQRLLADEDELPQEHLTRIASRLNTQCVGLSWQQITLLIPALEIEEQAVVSHVVDLLHSAESQEADSMFHDGLANAVTQPEFSSADRIRTLVELLEHGTILHSMGLPDLQQSGVHVIIGRENLLDEMKECSVVVARYGSAGKGYGVVAVIGPTRMAYGRSVSTVSLVSQVLSDLVAEYYS